MQVEIIRGKNLDVITIRRILVDKRKGLEKTKQMTGELHQGVTTPWTSWKY